MSETKLGLTVPLWTGGAGGGGGAPSGPAGGDLRGTYPNPIVKGLQTFPIALTAPIQGQALTWSGIAWHGFTQDYVIWRPGGVSVDDVVTTWAAVEARIAATSGNITVLVDTSLAAAIVPAIADTECFGKVIFKGYRFIVGPPIFVTVADGGRLRNVGSITNLQISGEPTATPFIQQNLLGNGLLLFEGGIVTLGAAGTVPAIECNDDFTGVLAILGGRVDNSTGNPALSAISIASGKLALHAIFAQFGAGAPPNYPANLFSGDATTTLFQIFDASGPQVAQPNFAGTLLASPADYALGVQYDDTLVPVPSLGVSDVQAAIDVLKQQVAALGGYRTSFTDADLVAGVLTVTHNLGVRYNPTAVYDNNNAQIVPDSVIDTGINTLTMDFSSFQAANGGAIPGTWNVVVG